MATIRKKRSRYQVQVRRKGAPHISKTFHRLRDAQEWARKMEIQADRSELRTDRRELEKITLGDLVTRYLAEITPSKKSANSENWVLNAFLRHKICRKTLADLSSQDFAAYRDERLKEISGRSLKRNLSAVHNLFEMAESEWGIPLHENPLAGVRFPTSSNGRNRRLKAGEFEALICAARSRKNPLIEKVIIFALETAMRRGEILDLEWGNIDLERRSATILEAKNGYSRTVPLSPSAIAVLDTLPATHERVFFPLTANSVKMAWQRILPIAEVKDLHFHDLRHEAISRYFEMGMTVPEVSLISGHRDIRMLARYAHPQLASIQRKFNEEKASAKQGDSATVHNRRPDRP